VTETPLPGVPMPSDPRFVTLARVRRRSRQVLISGLAGQSRHNPYRDSPQSDIALLAASGGPLRVTSGILRDEHLSPGYPPIADLCLEPTAIAGAQDLAENEIAVFGLRPRC
jgi:hypothetical protein